MEPIENLIGKIQSFVTFRVSIVISGDLSVYNSPIFKPFENQNFKQEYPEDIQQTILFLIMPESGTC